jgi:branched-chain amino acid aminotransferase
MSTAPGAGRSIWLDGELVPWERATVHVLSQSLQRGTLVFDFMACYPGKAGPVILGLREHVDRFVRSAEGNGMPLRWDRAALVAAIAQTVRANPGAEFVKASAYWPGISPELLPVDLAPSVAIAAYSNADLGARPRTPAAARRPARLQIAREWKLPSIVLSPQLKIAASYTAATLAKRRARDGSFDDVLFLDGRGNVVESSTQSFFLVEHGVLRTASLDDALDSITRRLVLELARDERIPCKEEPIPRAALDSADEAFLSGTTTDVWAVECVDARRFGPPLPGPITRRLGERLARVIAGADPDFSPRWMQPV